MTQRATQKQRVGSQWNVRNMSVSDRCKLRRCAGKCFTSNDIPADAIIAFYQSLQSNPSKAEEPIWFAMMCLDCLWRDEPGKPPLPKLRFEVMLKQFKNKNKSNTFNTRIKNLLKMKWDNDGHMLRHLYSLSLLLYNSSPHTRPDFCALANDLVHWNSEQKEMEVQRRWIDEIYRVKLFEEYDT